MKYSTGIMRKGSFRLFFTGRTRRIVFSVTSFAVATLFVLVACSAPQSQPGQSNNQQPAAATDWKPVERALGKAGSMQLGDVYKFSLPRSDLKVTVSGVELKPALALGSWIAFKKTGDMTTVMGDLVLTEDEVTPVMTRLEEGGANGFAQSRAA